MAKVQRAFVCTECGGESAKWVGQCPYCQMWNTLVEFREAKSNAPSRSKGRSAAVRAQSSKPQALNSIEIDSDLRLSSGIGELDRVLGGGFVPGSVVLIGGDPGIGKSTILLQTLACWQRGDKALYISAEESAQQVAMRAQRIGSGNDRLSASSMQVFAETDLNEIMQTAADVQPNIMVVDSIQTVFTPENSSAAGSVSQVRDCAQQLVRYAKEHHCIVILVGHVTKEGHLAGPRILEHMVDAVLYFEGERHTSFRIIRGIKNRFGTVNEIGVFAMTDIGLKEVTNPSAMFVTQKEAVSGLSVLCTQEGSRSLLVEIQALVDPSQHANPRRLAVGLDSSRLAMVLAILHRHAGLSLLNHDVFLNVAGGIRITEPAADLAVALAIHSSARGWAMSPKTAVFGELGLTGEVRAVQRGQDRIREASKLGYERILIPRANRPKNKDESIEIIACDTIIGALKHLKVD